MTTLTQDEIKKFWIRVYLGTTNEKELIVAAIDRAYRDLVDRRLASIVWRSVFASSELRLVRPLTEARFQPYIFK